MIATPYKQTIFFMLNIIFVSAIFTNITQGHDEISAASSNNPSDKDENKNNIQNKEKQSDLNSSEENQNHYSDTDESKKLITLFAQARSKSRKCGRKRYRAAEEMRSDYRLMRAAQEHAEDMNDKRILSHRGSDNSTVGSRTKRAGFIWKIVGENVAQGQKTEAEALSSWLDSPAHCKNIMNPKFDKIGVGRAGDYWVAVFARAQ